jgi:bacillithiol biosynthesis cysteine-adding enzyme BshC
LSTESPAPSTSIDVSCLPYTDVPLIGADSVLARLSGGDLTDRAPMLDIARPALGVDSPHLDRDRLADTLGVYNRRVGNPLSAATLDAIRADARFVVAGQQPGLLTGPLYIPLKAITSITLAKRLSQATGADVLPAFWVASEDHDLAEVNRAYFGEQKIVLSHAELNAPGPNPPVGRVSLEPFRDQILEFARQQLSNEPFGDSVIEALRRAPFDNYADFFAFLIAWMFPGRELVLIDPMCLRELAAPVMAEIAERFIELEAAFEEGTAALKKLGLDAPLEKINLFRFADGGRIPAEEAERDRRFIHDHPEDYSPGAALRPIVQDAVLPVAATVAGPTELLYLWQIDPLYRALGLRRSSLHPRLGATVIDAATAESAAALGLEGSEVLGILDAIDNLKNEPVAPEIEQLDALGRSLLDRIDELATDPDDKPIAKGRESIRHQLGKITQRLAQQRREASGRNPRRLKRVARGVYPQNQLQERGVSILPYLAQAGPGLIDALIERLDPAAPGHWLVTLSAPKTPNPTEGKTGS